jgi:outer membrane protein assembly factor BamB
VCKFGIRLPCSRAEVFALDATNGVIKWQDTVKLKLDQLDEHDTFINKGKQAHVVLTDSNRSIVILSLIANRILDT